MSNNRRAIGSQRRFGRSRGRGTSVRPPHRSPLTVERILAVPAVDRALGRLLAHPRALLLGGLVIGLVVVALALYPLLVPAARPTPALAPTLPASVAPAAPGAVEQEVVAVVAAYNQASITAAVLHQADVMAPFLAPEGEAWAEVQAEYQRRSTRGESHDPSMARWGVLRVAVQGDSATVETQEQWDDVTSVGGQVVSSRRGILTRNTYDLRRAPGAVKWLITSVTSTLVVG